MNTNVPPNPHRFTPFRTVLVPMLLDEKFPTALATACALSLQVEILGLVKIKPRASLSAGAKQARQMRRQLDELAQAYPNIKIHKRVRVSRAPWQDLLDFIATEAPDLLVLEWDSHLRALGVNVATVLTHPPCDVALVRGPFPQGDITHTLVSVRGGPHAELALRVGLALQSPEVTALHVMPRNPLPNADAPFRGLAQVLKGLPEVRSRTTRTADPAQTILRAGRESSVIVLGATAQPLQSGASLGVVADRVLREAKATVIAVKTRRPMPSGPPGEIIGAQAISILVDKWFAENTFHANEFKNLRQLVELKEAQGLTISLALPALNEEDTVGHVIRTIKRTLMDNVPLLDEIVLVDSDSVDRTRSIAERLGVPVYIHQELLPELGAGRGKGEALWKSLLVTHGDIVAWIDTDIVNIHPRFVYGILGPLLHNPRVQLVKAFYRRPLKVGEKTQAGGGGRVTELTARPLLNLFYPELSGVVQPLSGEYAGRRRALEQLPFFSGYGVETGLLIEVFERFGLAAVAQVDLLERVHHNQSLTALSKMSFAILQAVFQKLARRHGHPFLEEVNKSMKLIRYDHGGYALDVEEIVERERPPMISLPAYHHHAAA